MAISLDALWPPLIKPARLLVAQDPGGKVTSSRRSQSEQAMLYRRFLAGQSKYPAAPPGHSKHEIGEAFDFVASSPAEQARLGALWNSWGGAWSASDPIHFQTRP